MADEAPVCYLGGVPFKAGPEEVRWNFTMQTSEHKCIGGKVIQILGVTLGDLTVRGHYGSGKPGEEGDWQQQNRARERIKNWARGTEGNQATKPLRFLFPSRGWDFKVFIKAVSPMTFEVNTWASAWEFTLMVDQQGAREIVKDVEDFYIRRLMDGVGWKQTEYNGPSADETAAILAGQTVGEYLAGLAQQAYQSGLPGGQIGAHSS